MIDGSCLILKKTKFAGACPFYKTRNEVSWEEINESIKKYEDEHWEEESE